VIAKKGKVTVTDEVRFEYQTKKWSKPTQLKLEKISEDDKTVTVQVYALDDKGVRCLDAVNWVRFGLTGDGKLIGNQGTSTGSGYVQLYNGRALISIDKRGGESVVSAKSDNMVTVFLPVK
jgi:beta-galactosidase